MLLCPPIPCARVKHYETLCAEKRATVLPAFEPTRPGKTGKDMARNITTSKW